EVSPCRLLQERHEQDGHEPPYGGAEVVRGVGGESAMHVADLQFRSYLPSGRKDIVRKICAKAAPARPHLVAVLAFDGVVLADLSTPCEVLARVRTPGGAPAYELRVCSESTPARCSTAGRQLRPTCRRTLE